MFKMGDWKAAENNDRPTAIPDVAGFVLEKAERLLEDSGVRINTVKIITQHSEKNIITDYDKNFRVVRVITLDENTVELHVCKPL